MTIGRERTLAGLAMGAVILAWVAIILSLCYVPHLALYRAEIGAPLSSAQRLLLFLSSVVGGSFMITAPLLLLATGAVLRWRIRAARCIGRTGS